LEAHQITNRSLLLAVGAIFSTLALASCSESSNLPAGAGVGPNPTLPEPTSKLVPTVNIAAAKGWVDDAKPTAANGFAVNAFARDLDHPRMLHVLPSGDVLVAESNSPPRAGGGIRGWVMGLAMKRAGAAVPSPNRITMLRDTDGDGVAETRSVFLTGLNSPFGMALIGQYFYVANTDAVMRFPYTEGQREITEPGVKVADLPAGEINHHWTKDMVASRDGSRLYVTVGSNSDHGENGIDNEERRAAILEINLADGQSRVFASGLRNPNGLGWEPQTGALWVVVNERDELGNDLVPDYLTSVKDGAFYGWPYSYYGQHLDSRVTPQRPDLVAKAIAPDYALGSHVAPLGMAFADGKSMPERYRNGAFVGMHGSWNRSPRSGYKVVFVPFADGKPNGQPVDVLTGFIANDVAQGRPVGVAIDRSGALLVADDVGNTVWRVAPGAATVGGGR
jgi:glucose/arabinose dehydrogenase